MGKKADQNCKEDIPLIKSGHKRDCDYGSNPYRHNFVDSCDNKNFRRKMNVNIEVDFEDNMTCKEDITELRRGPAVQNRNEIYGGPYDNHAAVQPSCTTSKQNLIKIPEIQLPGQEQRLLLQLFSPEIPQVKVKRDAFGATPIGNQPCNDITGEKIVPLIG